MSSSKDYSLGSRVPTLDGTNYRLWAIQMGNFLRAKGLWQYTSAQITRPANPPDNATLAQAQTARDKQQEWDLKDDEAIGFIMLYVTPSLHDQQGNTAHRTWENLKSKFEKQGAANIYNDFQRLVNYRISGSKHPGIEIDNMDDHLMPMTLSFLNLLNV